MKDNVSPAVIGGSGLYAMDELRNVTANLMSDAVRESSDLLVVGSPKARASAFFRATDAGIGLIQAR